MRRFVEIIRQAALLAVWMLACVMALLRGETPPPRPVGAAEVEELERAREEPAADADPAREQRLRVARLRRWLAWRATGDEIDPGEMVGLTETERTWLVSLDRRAAAAALSMPGWEIAAAARKGRPRPAADVPAEELLATLDAVSAAPAPALGARAYG